jgi:uncharacterized membrane protein YjgN (DUF898 family)
MIQQERTVRVEYSARSRDVLAWFVQTAFFSLITLGLYLPVAVNRLVRYMCQHTEIKILELQTPAAEQETQTSGT